MTTDIVERLRNSVRLGNDPKFYMLRNADIAEAANEIEQLHSEKEGLLAEITRLRAKLRRVMGR